MECTESGIFGRDYWCDFRGFGGVVDIDVEGNIRRLTRLAFSILTICSEGTTRTGY